jgi:type 1 fimbria pilin
MKSLAIATIAVLTATTFVFAQAAATEAGTVTLKGTVIDNACGGGKTPEQLAAFVKTHTKECLKAGSARVGEFLRKSDSKTDVVVTGRMVGDTLEPISIENQK